MRLVVTGITGFLGSHLARSFVHHGHDVVGIVRNSSKSSRIRDFESHVSLVDVNSVDGLFRSSPHIDAVLHTATSYGRNGESSSNLLSSNVLFPIQLLEHAITAGVPSFINTDTALERHVNFYSLSKHQFVECARKVLEDTPNTKFMNLRCYHMYGPGDRAESFVPFLVRNCMENIPELRLTKGDQKRDFIYIDDVIQAVNAIVSNSSSRNQAFMQYDIGTGTSISVRSLVEKIRELTHSTTNLRFGEIPYRQHELTDMVAQVEPLRELGWSPQWSLEQGLREVINRYKA